MYLPALQAQYNVWINFLMFCQKLGRTLPNPFAGVEDKPGKKKC